MSDRQFWEPSHWFKPDNDHIEEPELDWVSNHCENTVLTPYGQFDWHEDASESLQSWASNDDDLQLQNGVRPLE